MVHFCPAIGAESQPGEHSHLTHFSGPAALLPGLLNQLPGVLVDDSLVGIFKSCVDKQNANKKIRTFVRIFSPINSLFNRIEKKLKLF